MNCLRLVKNKFRYISYSVILIFIVTSCSKLFTPLSVGKHRKQGDNRLLKDNKRVKTRTSKRSSEYVGNILHWAVIKCKKNVVNAILQHNSVNQIKQLINQKDSSGYTPIYWCLDPDILAKLNPCKKKDYLYIFNRLLNHPYSDLSILGKDSRNLIHWVVISKYVQALQLIFNSLTVQRNTKQLDELKKQFNQKDSFGYPPLHYLVCNDVANDEDMVILKKFLDNDLCNINAKDPEYFSLFYWLVYYNQSRLLEEMLASEKVETFRQFICNSLDQYYIFSLGESDRYFYLNQLFCSVKEMLRRSVTFLKKVNQEKLDINDIKRTFLTRYFGVYGYNEPFNREIHKELDILNLIQERYKADEEINLLQQQMLDEINKDINFISEIFDCSTIELDQFNDPQYLEEEKVFKDFIERLCKKYTIR